jgi:hypothetical protein
MAACKSSSRIEMTGETIIPTAIERWRTGAMHYTDGAQDGMFDTTRLCQRGYCNIM